MGHDGTAAVGALGDGFPDLDELPELPDPPVPWEWLEAQDALDDELIEAVGSGDAGWGDRVLVARWPELEALDALDPGPEPIPPDDDGFRLVGPSDPLERTGPLAWLALAAREHNTSQARFLAAVHVTAHHRGLRDRDGRPVRDPFALDEIAAARGWSRSMAGAWLTLAETVIDRLPRLHAAMAEGWLELGKAKAIIEATRAMPDDLAAMVTARVLPHAEHVSTGELGLRAQVAAIELDADWATRREHAARARVRLEHARNPEGTSDLALRDLDAETGARLHARVEDLAWPLRSAGRAAGLAVGIVLCRALVTATLLDHTSRGLDDDALLTLLIDTLPTWLDDTLGTSTHQPDDPDPDPGPDDGGPDDGGPDEGPDEGPDDGPDDGGPDGTGGGARVGTVELRMRLTTALGLDDLPAYLPGTGVLTARAARRMLTRSVEGSVPVECRLVLVDDDGHLEHVLLVAPDPSRPRRPRARPRGRVILELAAPTATLAALDPDTHPIWAPWLRRAQHALNGLADQDAQLGGTAHPATTLADAERRLPRRALARWIRSRDRWCIGPTCIAPAHRAEIDHTRDWADHGRSIADNLGSPCAHCHRLKHEGHWRLEQPAPGRFVWTSPLGATYTIARRRVLEPPATPAPRPDHRRRPLHGLRRPPPPEDPGLIDRSVRLHVPAEVPTPRRPWPPESHRRRDDEPPPF